MLRLMTPVAVTAYLLCGCAAVPKLGPAPALRAASTAASTDSIRPVSASWPTADWWTAFGDPQLTALIDEGLKNAPSVAAAEARVRAAKAIAEQAGGARGPQLEVTGSAGGVKQSENLGIPPDFVPKGILDTGQVAAKASFDLDLWGKNLAAVRAARGDAAAAQVEADQARMMIASNVAASYAELQQYHLDRDVAQDALRARQATATLTSQRVEVGVDTRGSLRQAESRVPSARADISALDEAIALTQHRIAALIGAGPDRGLRIARPRLVSPPLGIPANAGIDLIGRRPDLLSARLRAEALADRIKVARADFYPNINLSVLAGFQSLGLNNLFLGGSTYGNGGAAFTLPIFDGGQIAGRYRQARAQYDEAVANYDTTLLTSLREVADAATSRAATENRLSEQQAALAAAAEASNIARLRYRGGLSNQLAVLVAEDSELSLRRTVADLEARRIALDIALIRALGGGYRTGTQMAGAR